MVGKYPEVLVLEYGSEKPGDIENLCKIARPKIAVITEIGPAHLKNYKSIEDIAKEKFSLTKCLLADGIAMLNEDNKLIKKFSEKVFVKIVWYHGSSLDGATNAADVVSKVFDIKKEKITTDFQPKIAKGRLNIIPGIGESTIVDDTYNSNPLSVSLALEKIKQMKKNDKSIKRAIIVLGDMLELGKREFEMHNEVADRAKACSDIFIGVGHRFKDTKHDNWYMTPMEAGEYLQRIIEKGDIILVKGSQGIRMEKVIEQIILDKNQAGDLLVRQSPAWKKTIFKQP